LIGNRTVANGASWMFENVDPGTDTIRLNQGSSIINLNYGNSPTFVGSSRNSSSQISYRFGGSTATAAATSQSPLDENILLWRFTSNYSSAGISFYSIGESLDLSKLDSRVDRLVSELAFNINTGLDGSIYDIDTLKYINAGYAAGGTLS
jgi:hypothetical protein